MCQFKLMQNMLSLDLLFQTVELYINVLIEGHPWHRIERYNNVQANHKKSWLVKKLNWNGRRMRTGGCQSVAMPGLAGSRLSTYWPTKWSNKWRCSELHTSAEQTPTPCAPVALSGLNQKGGCSSALKPDRLGLSGKDNQCSDAGTGDLGVLTIHETSPMKILIMTAQPSQGECRHKNEEPCPYT